VAIAHHITPTGYKCANARPVLCPETTSKFFQTKVLGAASATAGAKKLMPYAPDAPRNRPKETLTNDIGHRFGPSAVTRRRERYRGASSITFGDASRSEPWRTTNDVMRARAAIVATTGLDNPGISAAIAKRVHASQRR
jgi:hypothetical protein